MELTRDIYEQVLATYNEYCGCTKGFISYQQEDFLDEKFPKPFKKGDIVKHKGGAIVYITDFEKGEGFGFFEAEKDWSFKTYPQHWKLADHKEWLEKLTKEAKRRGLVEGVKVKCLNDSAVERILYNFNHTLAQIKAGEFWMTSEVDLVLVMKNGEWAKPLSNLEVKIEELKELAQKEKMEIEVIFKNK